MLDMFASLGRQFAIDPVAVTFELLLIAAAVNWCVGVLHGTRGTRLFRGIVVVLIVATLGVRVLAVQMEWTRLALLYRYFIVGLGLMALVAFQPELRRAFIRAGDVRFARRGTPQSRLIAALVESLGYLSRNKFGALIAIQRGVGLRGWAENGTLLNAEVTANLLNTIFYPNSALHDLGVIIQDRRVLAAGCQFPQAESDEVEPGLGSRHRAAVGLSQESDALVLVVSEETGTISLADQGRLIRYLSLDDVKAELEERLAGHGAGAARHRAPRSISDAWRICRRLVVVAPLALVIWYLADQASRITAESVDVQLQVRSPSPDLHADVLQPAPSLFKVDFRGSTRAINELRAAAALRPLQIEWVLDPSAYPPGETTYSLSAKRLLSDAREITQRGLAVEHVAPPAVEVRVDGVVQTLADVRVDTGDVSVTDLRVDPPRVQVRMRNADFQRLPPEQRVVVVELKRNLETAEPDAPFTAADLPLPRRIGPFTALGVTPSAVSVSLRIVGRQATREVTGVPVVWMVPDGVQRLYAVEPADPNELLVTLTLRGERDALQKLDPRELRAFVEITGDDATSEWLSREVSLDLPRGVVLDEASRRPVVRFRLVERHAP